MVELTQANSEVHFAQIKELFIEYANSLDFDLCFQQFDKEISGFPGEYSAPDGCLILAKSNNYAVGCVGLRKVSAHICEMKRLYVKPRYRGNKIGEKLVELIIDCARQRGYRFMRLDTISTMNRAITLYYKFGFKEIEPYRHNPIQGAKYMELKI